MSEGHRPKTEEKRLLIIVSHEGDYKSTELEYAPSWPVANASGPTLGTGEPGNLSLNSGMRLVVAGTNML